MSKLQKILLGVLIIFSLLLRFYRLDSVPSGLYYDEVDLGYQARSLIQTGKDYMGSFSPFYVHSFNDFRAPIPAYLTVLTTLIFKTPEIQVRGQAAIVGSLVVVLILWLMLALIKDFKLAFITGIVFATSPWQIQFSRFAHEGTSMLALYLLGLIFFYKALSSKKFKLLFLSVIFFSVDVYTYRTMSLYVPLTFLFLFIIYFKEILSFGTRKLTLLILIASLIILPFMYATTLGAKDTPRAKYLSILSDQSIPVWIQRDRELDSGDLENHTLGKSASKLSYFFHNKPLSWLNALAINYYSQFSMDFLFLKGDINQRQSVGHMGELFYIDILALIAGLYFIGKNLSDKKYKLLLTWFLTAPIPASLTIDGANHAGRLFIFSAPLLIIVGIGWWVIFNSLRNVRFSRMLTVSIGAVWVLVFIFYLHRYFVHFPVDSARSWGYGFKEAIADIMKEEKNYKSVLMFPTNDPPMLYFLYWSKTPPSEVQKYGSNFDPASIKGSYLDKFKVGEVNTKDKRNASTALREDTLYLTTANDYDIDLRKEKDVPKGLKIIDAIYYPDNEPDFYLVTKDLSRLKP